MFLADRYIKGECPNCGAKDQYGDACENCSAVYSPTDLKNPYSTLSGATPVLKTSEHYFFRLSDPKCMAFLQRLAGEARAAAAAGGQQGEGVARRRRRQGARRLGHLARRALLRHPRARTSPRRSTSTSGSTRRSATSPASRTTARRSRHRLREVPADPEHRADPLHRQGHHLLPHAVLAGDAASSPASPTRCPTTSTCTASSPCPGDKMSKSRGTGISPLRYLELGMNPEWLRYYIAAKLNANVEDLDFNPDDFLARVNSDLVGKYVNIASRCVRASSPSASTASSVASALNEGVRRTSPPRSACRGEIAACTKRASSARRYGDVMELADRSQRFVDAEKPWELAKEPGKRRSGSRTSAREALEAFRLLSVLLAPGPAAHRPSSARSCSGVSPSPGPTLERSARRTTRSATYRHLHDPRRGKAARQPVRRRLRPAAHRPAAPRRAAAARRQGEIRVRHCHDRRLQQARPARGEASPRPSTSKAPTSC